MTTDDAHYEGALLEEVNDKLDRLAEALADVPAQVQQIRDDLAQLKSDVSVARAVITDQSQQVARHEDQLAALAQQLQA